VVGIYVAYAPPYSHPGHCHRITGLKTTGSMHQDLNMWGWSGEAGLQCPRGPSHSVADAACSRPQPAHLRCSWELTAGLAASLRKTSAPAESVLRPNFSLQHDPGPLELHSPFLPPWGIIVPSAICCCLGTFVVVGLGKSQSLAMHDRASHGVGQWCAKVLVRHCCSLYSMVHGLLCCKT